MKKFEFTLSSVLRIKYSLEKQVKQQMAEAISRRNLCQEEIDKIVLLKEEARKNNNSFTAYEYVIFSRYYADLENKRKAKVIELHKIEEEIETIRKELLKITEERKVLEKLKEKQYEEYLLELNKEQDKIIDDMLTYNITIA